MLIHALSALLIGFVVLTGSARAEPEVFSKAGYEADRAAAVEQGRLHIVYVRSETCNTSGVLESRRWIKPEITSWVEAHGIVTRVDVKDSESQAKELGILVTPTLVVFRDDEELGRAHGAWWVDDLVQWLEHLRTGAPLDPQAASNVLDNKSGTPILEWFYEQRAGEDRLYLEEKVPFLLGQEHLVSLLEQLDESRAAGDVDTEVRLYLWLIRNGNVVYAVSPDPVSLAVSYLTEGLQNGRLDEVAVRSLADALEIQAHAYTTLRPRELGPSAEAEYEPLRTWVSLSGALQNWDELVEWTVGQLEIDEQEVRSSGFSWVCEEAAINTSRWDVLARLIPDPIGSAQSVLEMPLAAMGFDIVMGGDADDDQMERMKDGVAWGIYHPAIAAMTAEGQGEMLTRFLNTVEEGMGSAHLWRVAVLFAASRVEKIEPQYIEWIQAHDLLSRYPQYAEHLKLIEDAWSMR